MAAQYPYLHPSRPPAATCQMGWCGPEGPSGQLASIEASERHTANPNGQFQPTPRVSQSSGRLPVIVVAALHRWMRPSAGASRQANKHARQLIPHRSKRQTYKPLTIISLVLLPGGVQLIKWQQKGWHKTGIGIPVNGVSTWYQACQGLLSRPAHMTIHSPVLHPGRD